MFCWSAVRAALIATCSCWSAARDLIHASDVTQHIYGLACVTQQYVLCLCGSDVTQYMGLRVVNSSMCCASVDYTLDCHTCEK